MGEFCASSCVTDCYLRRVILVHGSRRTEIMNVDNVMIAVTLSISYTSFRGTTPTTGYRCCRTVRGVDSRAVKPGSRAIRGFASLGGLVRSIGVSILCLDPPLPSRLHICLHLGDPFFDLAHQVSALPVEAQVHPVIQT